MRRLAVGALLLLVVAGALAPLLANDVPLIARTVDGYRFPAFAAYSGSPGAAPGGRTWKDWWASPDRPARGEWALMPPWPHGPAEVAPERICAAPSVAHPLGTDDTGRDLLARLLHGAFTTLLIGGGTVLLAAAVGVPAGALAGWFAFSWIDALILRVVEVCMCFPALFLALTAVAVLGGSALSIVLVLATCFWTGFARLVRGEFLSLRERPFVHTARGLGVPLPRLLARHLLPQVRGAILVHAAFVFAGAMIVETGLAFLGLGAGLQSVSWGSILAQGKEHAGEGVWHLWLFPTLVLVATIVALHAVADEARVSART